MKIRFGTTILFSVLGISPVFAQNNFELVGPLSPPVVTIDEIPAVSQGGTAMADIDNDGDQDILVSGFSVTSQVICKLYVNNGAGGYTLKPSSFNQTYNGSVHFVDVDGDNDMDVLITGMFNQPIAKLYLNDGLGNFTLDASTPFVGVVYGSAAIADVNGDSAPDILIFGNSTSGISTSLYMNNGTGGFTLAPGTPFEGVTYGQAAFADTDGDTDKDLVITGLNISNIPITRYYENDGSGIFTPAPTNITNIQRGTINFGDLDGDNDMDALITGVSGSGILAEMYTNNGTGTFTLVSGTPFTPVHSGSVAFGDTDGDGDTDILLAGAGNSGVLAKLYNNNGTGLFTTVAGALFQGVAMGNAFLTDIDGDNDRDAFLIGSSGTYGTATFYTNDAGAFTPLIKSPFTGVLESASAFADIDGDSDIDVLISGKDLSGSVVARLYTNDGNGYYTIVPGTPFEGVSVGDIGFSDIDGDGDQDVLITGYHINHSTAKLYTNNGAGVFTLVAGTPFSPNQRGSLNFSDIDGDGDEDVLLTGYNGSYQSIAELYVNTAGTFSLVAGTPFIGLSYSNAAFSDLDGDNDQDLIINGYNGSFQPITQQFSNDGTGVFSAIASSSLLNVGSGSIAFGDIDGDNDLDLFLTGADNTNNRNSKLYSNDGSGVFTELTSGIAAFNQNSSAFTDVDNDGDLDLLVAGYANTQAAMLYNNNGTGIFTEVIGTPFKGISSGSLSIADIDGNGKPDVLITGADNNTAPSAFLYRNMNCTPTTGIAVHEACNAFTWIDGVDYTSSTSTPTWILTNATGCDSTVTLHLTIQDLIAPVADSLSLENVVTSCAVTALDVPTAIDNCAGSIQGTTAQVFPITTEGTTVVTWTYDDGNGHITTQTQQVIISYDVAPVPVEGMLPDVIAECAVNGIIAPTATENCTGAEITATTGQVFPITAQDTTIVTWTYEDVYGNSFTQTQNVILSDITAPVANVTSLNDITANCSFNLNDAIPTATDACTGTITGTTANDSIVSAFGTTVITWTYDDGNGNTSTQTQNIIITDTEAPAADATVLPTISAMCFLPEIDEIPTATDGCSGQVQGTTTQLFPITTVGTTVIVWTFEDANGNISTQTQDVIVTAVDVETSVSANNMISANNGNGTYQWIDCNGNTPVAGATMQAFTPTANGLYAVIVTENGCSETSACVSITTVGLNELASHSALQIYPNPNTGSFIIDASQAVTIEIRNASGQLIFTQVLEAGQTAIELNQIESGIYFISAIDENYTVYRVSVVH
jgi:hypothetical protein